MRCIETQYFRDQLKKLKHKYYLVEEDYKLFVQDFSMQESTHLGNDTYKCRWKNSSIPKGKSGWLRFIV